MWTVSSVLCWHVPHHLFGSASERWTAPWSRTLPLVVLLDSAETEQQNCLLPLATHAMFSRQLLPIVVEEWSYITTSECREEKNNKICAICGPNVKAISWAGMYLKSFPVPNAIQSWSMPGRKSATASKTTYVSTVLIITVLKPEFGMLGMKKQANIRFFIWTRLKSVQILIDPRANHRILYGGYNELVSSGRWSTLLTPKQEKLFLVLIIPVYLSLSLPSLLWNTSNCWVFPSSDIAWGVNTPIAHSWTLWLSNLE